MSNTLNNGESDSSVWKKKTWFSPQSVTLVVNVLAIFFWGAFYFGVVKTELDTLKRTSVDLVDKFNQNDQLVRNINAKGTEALQKREAEIVSLKAKVDILENVKILSDQRDLTVSKDISGLDARVVRLEDAIPKISLMTQRVETIETVQREMKVDLKELSKMPVQLEQLKGLIQNSAR